MKIIAQRKENYQYYKDYKDIAIKKYGEDLVNKCGYKAYISDKGNFVLENRTIVPKLDSEIVKERIEDYKKRCKRITDDDKKWYNYSAEYYSLFMPRFHDEVNDVMIIVKRLIITPEQVIYKSKGRKFWRLSAKEGKKVLMDTILNLYTIFNDCETEIVKELIKYLQNFKYIKNWPLNCTPDLHLIHFLIKMNDVCLSKNEEKFLKNIEEYKSYHLDVEHFFSTIEGLNKNKIVNPDVRKKYILNFRCEPALLYGKKYLNDLREFYKNTLNVNPDLVFLNRTINGKFVIDTMTMYNKHKRHEKKCSKIRTFPNEWYKLNFNDLHKRLSELLREDYAVLEQIDYSYSENVLSLEKCVQNYIFKLPSNSIEISRIANLLSNCVANYSQRNNKTCLIMYGYKDERVFKYIKTGEGDVKSLRDTEPLCIELTPYKKEPSEIVFKPSEVYRYGYLGKADNVVSQCYAPYNHYVSKEVGIICNQYFDSIGYHHIDFVNQENYFKYDDLPF